MAIPNRSLICSCAILVTAHVSLMSGTNVPVQERPVATSSDEVRSLIAAGRYETAERAGQRLVVEQQTERGAQTLASATAIDALVEALLANGKGASPATQELATRAVRIKERVLKEDDFELSISLRNLAKVLMAAGDGRRSMPLFERALGIRERVAGATALTTAEALDDLADAQLQSDLHVDANASINRAWRIKEGIRGIDARVWARSLEQLASLLQKRGDYAGARPLLEQALHSREASSENHPELIETLTLFGNQLLFEGDPHAARVFFTRALTLAERDLRPDHPIIAVALRNLASAAKDLGDFSDARALRERALSTAEKNYGPKHRDLGGYLNDLANSYVLQGDYVGARAVYERALRIVEEGRERDGAMLGTRVYNLANVHAQLGDFVEARRLFERARMLWRLALGREHPYVAVATSALAEVLLAQKQYAEAVALFQQALTIQERALGPSHREVAATCSLLATALERAGHASRARELSARALGIWERSNAPDSPRFAQTLTLYANLEANRGDFASARHFYQQALEIRSRVLGTSHPLYAETQSGLAVTLAGLGDTQSAIRAALDADETGRQHLRATVRYLPERQSLGYAASRPKGLDLAMSLATDNPGDVARVFDAVVKDRALVLDEMAARRSIQAEAASGHLAPLWTALVSARQRLANVVVRGPSEQRPEQYAKLVEDARLGKELAERALVDSSASFRQDLKLDAVGLEAVRGALPPSSALVAFVRYERIVMSGSPNVPATTVDARRPPRKLASYMAFVVFAGQADVSVLPLGSASTIDILVAAWREALTNIARTTSPSDAGQRYRVAGVSLRQRVWDPITNRLKGVRTIFVVPDGSLNLLSLAALPIGRTRYLIDDGPVIHYLSAERDLVTYASSSTRNVGLLAVGGVAFDDASVFTGRQKPVPLRSRDTNQIQPNVRGACGDLPLLQFESLSATRQEVLEVARLWGPAVQLLENRRATERTFKESAPGHRVLHLATHGYFLGSECEPAVRGTRAVGRLTTASRPQSYSGTVDNPLLLSGLAFAGANRRAAAGPNDEDGILTAEEVASLNLQGVEWAVLSACDTGLGEIKAGEGVFGLRRAFQVAGVHTVIMSLWQVEDRAALAWMRALYEGRLKNRLTTAEAVHHASLAVLRARRTHGQSTHPFYWGAFVAAGDWK
jgi:CHAT domain-containing protein/tetratricopeptide (TPR) repeat protein